MIRAQESLWTSETSPSLIPNQSTQIPSSSAMRTALYEKFQRRISMNPVLDRTLVSFQGNKHIPFSSWFKYREGFSEALVGYLLKELKPEPGILLDPFAGAGSALFGASALGWQTKGIEVLPVGIHATRARMAASRMKAEEVYATIAKLKQVDFSAFYDEQYALSHITITRGAFPSEEEKQLIGYRAYCHGSIDNADMRALLLYAAFCILEEISYTRKDGQYLRWDARSGRSQGKRPFNKGRILTFREAIFQKLEQIAASLSEETMQQELFQTDTMPQPQRFTHEIELSEGSCLEILPLKDPNSIDFIMTSPPYANRYDY